MPADGGSQTDSAADLRREEAALAARSRSAVLELYGLDSRLAAAGARLASLEARSAALRHQRQTATRRLTIARQTLTRAELQLATRLRALYERGDADPLAVVLGAESLEDVLAAIDGLELAAEQDRAIIEQARSARTRFTRLSASLEARSAELALLVRSQQAETAALARARTERAAYIDRLASRRRLTASKLAQVRAAADAARQRTLAVAGPAPAVSAATAAPPAATASATGGRTLTVTASGYALGGTTATGIAVGWGVVAVDPSVIPLGTRMTIPGYGTGVASDTGGAVQGAHIDLWFPSEADAFAWGRRTVTITLD